MKKYFKQKGFSLLPTVLVTSIIVAEVGIALSFVMYMANSASFASRLLQESYLCAKSAMNDAYLRIIRNKDFSAASGYNITLGRCTANVVVQKDVPAQYATTITVTATVLNRKKTLQGIVSIDPDNGTALMYSLQEL